MMDIKKIALLAGAGVGAYWAYRWYAGRSLGTVAGGTVGMTVGNRAPPQGAMQQQQPPPPRTIMDIPRKDFDQILRSPQVSDRVVSDMMAARTRDDPSYTWRDGQAAAQERLAQTDPSTAALVQQLLASQRR